MTGVVKQAEKAPEIEFWFEFGSNYSYLSVMRIEEETRRHGVRIARLKDRLAFRSSEPPVAGQAAARSCVCRIPRRTLALRRQPYRAAYRSLARLSCTRILLLARA